MYEPGKTPLAVFTYNRPQYTKSVLESISKCFRLDECTIYVFCDGPKSSDQERKVSESIKVVKSFEKGLNLKIIIRDRNFGLAESIVDGVTILCSQYGRVIVIEDDLLVSPSFIDFMLQGLDHYQDETRVFQIVGFMFPIETIFKTDAVLMPFTSSWGWATWERAWKFFDWNATGYEKLLSDKALKRKFDLNDSYPYYNMLIDRMNGKNSSWAILWWYSVFKEQGLALHPKKSLVYVGGFDGTGTHCTDSSMNQTKVNELFNFVQGKRISFPTKCEADLNVFKRLSICIVKRQKNKFLQRLIGLLVEFYDKKIHYFFL